MRLLRQSAQRIQQIALGQIRQVAQQQVCLHAQQRLGGRRKRQQRHWQAGHPPAERGIEQPGGDRVTGDGVRACGGDRLRLARSPWSPRLDVDRLRISRCSTRSSRLSTCARRCQIASAARQGRAPAPTAAARPPLSTGWSAETAPCWRPRPALKAIAASGASGAGCRALAGWRKLEVDADIAIGRARSSQDRP